MVIDLPSDKGLAHFHALSRILDLPEFVKQADFTEQVETNDLPREAFADPLDKKFPIHTKTAAYLSYAYFLTQAGQLDKAARDRCVQGFNKAANYWDLGLDFINVSSALNKKAEVKEGQFALKHCNENFFPINNPSEIMKSAFDLEKNRGNFDYTLRSQAAKGIMKAAAEVGLPLTVLSESIHRMAGCGITTKTAAMIELTSRWDNEKRPALAEPLHTCIEALDGLKSDMLGGEVCEKIASIIDRYDRLTAGVTTFPEDVLFAFTKQAADKIAGGLVSMVDGTSYWINELEKAAEAFGVLGKDIVKSIQDMDGSLNPVKVAELVDTLPRIDAELLKDALRGMGVRPVVLDKHAMVSMVVSTVQTQRPLTTIHHKVEKRSCVLQKLEAQDPMIKRALDVVRRLKTAEDKTDKVEEAPNPGAAETPRGLKGLFMKKAPNEAVAEPAK